MTGFSYVCCRDCSTVALVLSISYFDIIIILILIYLSGVNVLSPGFTCTHHIQEPVLTSYSQAREAGMKGLTPRQVSGVGNGLGGAQDGAGEIKKMVGAAAPLWGWSRWSTENQARWDLLSGSSPGEFQQGTEGCVGCQGTAHVATKQQGCRFHQGKSQAIHQTGKGDRDGIQPQLQQLMGQKEPGGSLGRTTEGWRWPHPSLRADGDGWA